jgi:hypothetical protein
LTRTQRQIEEHRKGDAIIQVRDEAGSPCAGHSVWVEQENHEFLFGCVVPDLDGLPASDRTRYRARLEEVFNRLDSAEDARRVEVQDQVPLGRLRREFDRHAAAGLPLDVHVSGQTIGVADRGERASAHRLAELYTLCFAHPSVRGIFWHGFRDGDREADGGGLLRRDLSPKSAHRVLQKLIGVIWHSRAAGRTDAEGRFPFRGFWGTYRVAVRAGEEAATVTSVSLHRRAGAVAPFVISVGPWTAASRPIPSPHCPSSPPADDHRC